MKKIFIFIFLISHLSLSLSDCVLPSPDLGDENASPPNYSGHLKYASKNFILVKDYRGKSQTYIDTSKINNAYSAFGGDEIFEKLKPGIAVRIWYKNCKFKKNPEAIYVEYFSNNHLDQPSAEYFDNR